MIYDILILGAGWTSTFLIPILQDSKKKYAATTTTGRNGTIKFSFDPHHPSPTPFAALPNAHTILVTFPLTGAHASQKLVSDYAATHDGIEPRYIQLGSTGIYQSIPQPDLWITRTSPYDTANPRAIAEDALIRLGGVVLNLSGLWGDDRQPRNFVDRVFKTKSDVEGKGSLHMVHGRDVARGIVKVMEDWPGGSRWMLTDGFVYDWWSLLVGWGSSSSSSSSVGDGKSEEKRERSEESEDDGRRDAKGEVVQWVFECMRDGNVRALPRSMESLGRCYDSRDFWETFKLVPVRARI